MNMDMNCLRTFVTIVDAGSFADAAERVGRTASAVSLQIARLEEQVGTKLFEKQGRRMIPSADGEQLLGTARELLALNDQAVEALAHKGLSGNIALGVIQDVAEDPLPSVLARFRQSHPNVRISAKVDRSKTLAEAVDAGSLDLAVAISGWSSRPHLTLRSQQMVWLGSHDLHVERDEPVPLVVFEQPCSFRQAAIDALTKAGRSWEVVFTSPSLSGLRAAVQAGLGVTARTENAFGGELQRVNPSAGLPPLPKVELALYTPRDISEPAARLAELLSEQI